MSNLKQVEVEVLVGDEPETGVEVEVVAGNEPEDGVEFEVDTYRPAWPTGLSLDAWGKSDEMIRLMEGKGLDQQEIFMVAALCALRCGVVFEMTAEVFAARMTEVYQAVVTGMAQRTITNVKA